MEVQSLADKISQLNLLQLKDVYVNLFEMLEPERELLITPKDIKRKLEKDRALLEDFCLESNVEDKNYGEFRAIKELAADFLIGITESFPEYREKIEASIIEASKKGFIEDTLLLDIPSTAQLIPIIYAVAVAILQPHLKVDRKRIQEKNSSTSEFHFELKLGTDKVVEVLKSLLPYSKKGD
ncbi:hypothetical protein [Desulfosporosinus sp. OT]|uniref:hypothetical protein n=1 Tax=Desulfosporosinus sp. OT TaxID=913865 RepID=UPI000223A4A2|nr:hypothetical protein [Desulfosporosinus sp. OT]EGW37855.1 hypothetical protein DOT_4263 [Desulfosporosinus sp. OT]